MHPEPFPVELRLEAISPGRLRDLGKGKQLYTVLEPFFYVSKRFGTIEVPPGFMTDFASVPRPVWSYISPEDPVILYGSVVHDFLYSTRGGRGTPRFSREEADEVLREAMLASCARTTQAWVVFRAVRLFGGSHWRGDS